MGLDDEIARQNSAASQSRAPGPEETAMYESCSRFAQLSRERATKPVPVFDDIEGWGEPMRGGGLIRKARIVRHVRYLFDAYVVRYTTSIEDYSTAVSLTGEPLYLGLAGWARGHAGLGGSISAATSVSEAERRMKGSVFTVDMDPSTRSKLAIAIASGRVFTRVHDLGGTPREPRTWDFSDKNLAQALREL